VALLRGLGYEVFRFAETTSDFHHLELFIPIAGSGSKAEGKLIDSAFCPTNFDAVIVTVPGNGQGGMLTIVARRL
jgi:hypothetical protein